MLDVFKKIKKFVFLSVQFVNHKEIVHLINNGQGNSRSTNNKLRKNKKYSKNEINLRRKDTKICTDDLLL